MRSSVRSRLAPPFLNDLQVRILRLGSTISATMRSSVRSHHFSTTYRLGFCDYVPQRSNSVHYFLFDPTRSYQRPPPAPKNSVSQFEFRGMRSYENDGVL